MPRLINTGVGGLNQWMGFALRWGGCRTVVARVSLWGVRVLVIVAGYGSWRTGEYLANEVPESSFDLGEGVTATPLDLSPKELEEQQEMAIQQLEEQQSE